MLPLEYKDLGEFRSRSPLKSDIKSEGIAVPLDSRNWIRSNTKRDVFSENCFLDKIQIKVCYKVNISHVYEII